MMSCEAETGGTVSSRSPTASCAVREAFACDANSTAGTTNRCSVPSGRRPRIAQCPFAAGLGRSLGHGAAPSEGEEHATIAALLNTMAAENVVEAVR